MSKFTKRCKNLLFFLSSFFSCSSCLAHKIEVQGHRGTRGTMPENTLPAFIEAIVAGTDVLELDLHITSDGAVVIYHDFFVRPDLCIQKNGALIEKKLIREMSLSAIKELDCGSKIDPAFPEQVPVPGTEIPTLQELFDCIKGMQHPNAQKIRFNLELKRDLRHPEYSADPQEFARKVLMLVQKNGFDQRVYYSSFDRELLTAVRKFDATATLALLYNKRLMSFFGGFENLIKLAKSLNIQILSPEHSLLQSQEDVQRLKEKGFKVATWTVNDPSRCKELAELGVDSIVTDYPAKLIELLKAELP